MFTKILHDITDHTKGISVFNSIKMCAMDENVRVYSIGTDNSVIMEGTSIEPVPEIHGVFGIGDLKQFATILRHKEYATDANIFIEDDMRNGIPVAGYITFNNSSGEFNNTIRLVSEDQINKRLPEVDSNMTISYDITMTPSPDAIKRFKSQIGISSSTKTFSITIENGDVIFHFGSVATTSGTLIFDRNVDGSISQRFEYPCAQFKEILELPGNKIVQISDSGLIQVVITTDYMNYSYLLVPTRVKSR